MRWLLAVAAVTLLAGGLRAREALAPDARRSVDEQGYVSVAIGLADSGRYGRRSLHWAPGAPAMFALAAKVSRPSRDDIPAAYWEQWAVGTALVPLVFVLAMLIGGSWAGLAAAVVVATYPPLVVAGGDLLSEPLGALLLTAAVVAFVARRPVPAGALLGAAVLTRANLLVCIPALALFAPPRFLAAALVPVALWSLNVSLDSGRPVLIANDGGSSLFVGTYAPGGGTLRGAKRALGLAHASGREAMDAVAARDPGAPREVALRREAWRNVRRDPLGVVALMPGKLMRLWLKTSRIGGTPLRAWHLLILALALVGLTRAPRAIVVMLLAFTAFHLVVVAMPRYALPVFPVLVASGAGGWGRRLKAGTPGRLRGRGGQGERQGLAVGARAQRVVGADVLGE